MYFVEGRPLTGKKKQETTKFLANLDLSWEEGLETTINLVEDGQICATGSRKGSVLKCIGVSPGHQGEGLSAQILTELIKDALSWGISHLYLYTKPENRQMFIELGFHEVAATSQVLLMENRKNGITDYLNTLPVMSAASDIAAIVANCNPFTNGHLYLVEEAAANCDHLYLFILSEDRSQFTTAERIRLAKEGTAHLSNITVYPTGSYLISTVTFPQYFLKEKQEASKIQCDLDLSIFANYYAPRFQIKTRYIGTEPTCPTTAQYNTQMKAQLPNWGIQVKEILRKCQESAPISASRVRTLMQQKDLRSLQSLVPDSTYQYIKNTLVSCTVD